jgi:hypothetical protein
VQQRVERLGAVGDDLLRHEGVGDVRPPDGGAGRDVGHQLVPADRVAGVLELADDRPRPRHPVVERHGHLVGQRGVRRVDAVAEQVQADAVEDGRDLGAAQQPQAGGQGVERLGPARHGVVVGERDDVQPGRGRGPHQRSRRLGAVGGRAVGVEVDEHGARLVAGQDVTGDRPQAVSRGDKAPHGTSSS